MKSSFVVWRRAISAMSASMAARLQRNGRHWSIAFVTPRLPRLPVHRCRQYGVKLQHASTLVNMDLPWNPAILEQRIGRIYRMGQKPPVRVINFVAKGTIEEGTFGSGVQTFLIGRNSRWGQRRNRARRLAS